MAMRELQYKMNGLIGCNIIKQGLLLKDDWITMYSHYWIMWLSDSVTYWIQWLFCLFPKSCFDDAALSDSVTYWILWLPWDRAQTVMKSNKLQNQIRLHHLNMTLGVGKTVTESNMSQNQRVIKSNNACTYPKVRTLWYPALSLSLTDLEEDTS